MAKKMCPNHPEDVLSVALALHTKAPVWTHDKAFSTHKELKVPSTNELLALAPSE